MTRSKGEMGSPRHQLYLTLLMLSLATICSAGPLGELPNITNFDAGAKEGGCTVGDVVYGAGEQFPGSTPCERCECAGGAVACTNLTCQPRPGCKALHRPDHCCPTYQCECEQEGRVYGNGEKLVDPQDPCRVCYCQGGEVVCRRIACFVRDDCTPRLVPGRCCPEYDNCPLRGVSTATGATASTSPADEATSSPAPTPPKENIKQEITIKEITPVSEIPVLSDVKIKEVLPSATIDVPNYSSSKAPLNVREATSENPIATSIEFKPETPVIIEITAAYTLAPVFTVVQESTSSINTQEKPKKDPRPSKISLASQDSINSDIYPSVDTKVHSMGSPSNTPNLSPISVTTKAPVFEEEDPALFEHNPAFPPLPDDLSVLGIHDDDTILEQTADGEHTHHHHTALPTTTTAREPVDTTGHTSFNVVKTSTYFGNKVEENTTDSSTIDDVNTAKVDTTMGSSFKDSPMLNLRSAIPTEILNIPSSVPEDINGELDDGDTTSAATTGTSPAFPTTEREIKEVEQFQKPIFDLPVDTDSPTTLTTTSSPSTTTITSTVTSTTTTTTTSAPTTPTTTTTTEAPKTTLRTPITQAPEVLTTNPVVKPNIVTEITAKTEFSSIPIETVDQNPRNSDINDKENTIPSTLGPTAVDVATTRLTPPLDAELITVSRADLSTSFENVETTEFVLTSFGSSETATDAIELIKISAQPEKSAAIIQPPEKKKNNVLTDLINLVGDVASIGDHTDGPEPPPRASAPTSPAVSSTVTISESEELIPVNAGYKSKNNNWNLNSITEVPVKSKSSTMGSKQKVVEMEEEEADTITDAPPPNDRVEPTTRRPTIDNVSDDQRPANTSSDTKDIEIIITKSYVPSINRRPTKVMMKKNEKPAQRSSAEEISTSVTSTTTEATRAMSDTSTVSESTASVTNTASEATSRDASTTSDPKPASEASSSNTSTPASSDSTPKPTAPSPTTTSSPLLH